MRYGARCERKLRDRASHIWQDATKVKGALPTASEESGLARFRNSTGYQRGMQVLKWLVLPDFVLLPLIVFLAVWLVAAGIAQTALPRLESGTRLCQGAAGSLEVLTTYEKTFVPSATCHPVGMTVAKDRRYRVELKVDEPWFDGSHATNPMGLRARDLGLAGILGGPFRRVIEANFLQPVVEIRQGSRSWPFDKVHINPWRWLSGRTRPVRRRVQGDAGRRAVPVRQRRRVAAGTDVLLPGETGRQLGQRPAHDRAARGGAKKIAAVRPAAIQAQAGR